MIYQAVDYPLPVPATGEVQQVVPGVWWLRLPLPGRLNHINVWAIEDGAGWALVDTGARVPDTVAVWERLTSRDALHKRPLTRVLVTHMHPDHIGMAGWLTRKYGVQLWISRLEYLSCRVLVSDAGREAPPDAIRFYEEAGWAPGPIESYRARFGGYGNWIYKLPDSYRRIEDGQRFDIGEHEWEVVGGNGHSPEHSCFYCPALKLLISGDQILPKISSNVSVQPSEPEADPMADWYASLATLERRVPDDVLVLPAHNDCFHGLHERIRQLRGGQDEALAKLREALREPRRVIDVFPALFRRPIDPADSQQFGLATGEAIACLNYLRHQGEVRKELRDGIAWYRLA